MAVRFPAEWEAQDGVLLAWPHEKSDWAPYLLEAEAVFANIVAAVTRYQKAVVVVPPGLISAATSRLKAANADLQRILFFELPTNDTWARDFGPLCIEDNGRPILLDYGFNGWGLKFPADLDNRINQRLHARGAFGSLQMVVPGLILEGGSVESDGCGTLLTTAQCLLSPNRNPHLARADIEKALTGQLGGDRVLWLEHGALVGDDTDSHIDTLARLCPEDTILHVHCDDPEDEHHASLSAMAKELAAFRTRNGDPYRLIPLPWPRAIHDRQGDRLPATYANYLVINGAVLVPTYNDPRDAEALAVVASAFPGREILGIDCSTLILQHGSLHCVTMQLPKGVLP
jgi:agmatine deiminase